MGHFEYVVFIFLYELFAVDMPCLTSLPWYTPKGSGTCRGEERTPRLAPLQDLCLHSHVHHGRAGVQPTLTSLVKCRLTANSPSTLGVFVLGAAQHAPFLRA